MRVLQRIALGLALLLGATSFLLAWQGGPQPAPEEGSFEVTTEGDADANNTFLTIEGDGLNHAKPDLTVTKVVIIIEGTRTLLKEGEDYEVHDNGEKVVTIEFINGSAPGTGAYAEVSGDTDQQHQCNDSDMLASWGDGS